VDRPNGDPGPRTDPFCREFFDDPFPVHAALRDAAPTR
jgi:hypothetical protein